MHKIKTIVLPAALAAALTFTAAAQALAVVAGSVSREAGSSVFVDNATGRQWLGAEVTKYFNYDQTVAALGQGGQFAGYSIASYEDVAQLARDFGNNGSVSCSNDGGGYASCSGDVSANANQVFGDSYEAAYSGTSSSYNYGDGGYGYQSYHYAYNNDYGWFLSQASDNGAQPMAGIFNLNSYEDYWGSGASVSMNQSWGSSATTDYYAGGSTGIGWMLVRNANRVDVPEPGTLALAALAVAGVAVTRRRRVVVGG